MKLKDVKAIAARCRSIHYTTASEDIMAMAEDIKFRRQRINTLNYQKKRLEELLLVADAENKRLTQHLEIVKGLMQ